MYRFLRSILFLLPAETAHYFSMEVLKSLCSIGFINKKIANQFTIHNSLLPINVFGLSFKNPVGMGAGFDKNAKYLRELETLGFGFVEIGTVTPKPQKGNNKPRLFRLPKDKALINRMGFNNEGVEVIAERLKKWRKKQLAINNGQKAKGNRQLKHSGNSPFTIHYSPLLIGGNIGKNKSTPNEGAWKDYEICFNALHPYVDFFVVNVSSPNTPGLRELQEKTSLKKILTQLQTENTKYEVRRPILLKIAPDLSLKQIDEVIDLTLEINLDGLVATNTTISRELLDTSQEKVKTIGAGGLSGKPLQQHSTEIIEYIHQKTSGSLPVIASGGIFDGNDAKKKFKAGAVLLEVWTGFIYAGPSIVKNICKALI
ncbi:MAG TPA: dihydroorotate dehydrogenase (quinone) [Chitinophagaceae bacterium]|nr:dihydroorotate dehydrogenase (quinone) [Chitinophagaceae bacterium]